MNLWRCVQHCAFGKDPCIVKAGNFAISKCVISGKDCAFFVPCTDMELVSVAEFEHGFGAEAEAYPEPQPVKATIIDKLKALLFYPKGTLEYTDVVQEVILDQQQQIDAINTRLDRLEGGGK